VAKTFEERNQSFNVGENEKIKKDTPGVGRGASGNADFQEKQQASPVKLGIGK